MNKNVLFISALAVLASVSCTKNPEGNNGALIDQKIIAPVIIRAGVDLSTKAEVAANGACTFTATTDVIIVNNGSGVYTGTALSSGKVVDFEMESGFAETGSGLAAFPADMVTSLSASKAVFYLPSEYTMADVSGTVTPSPMIATYTAGKDISFKQLCAIVRISVSDCVAGSLVFTFPTIVNGEATVTSVPSSDNEGITAVTGTRSITVNNVTAGDHDITLPLPVSTVPQNIIVTNIPGAAAASIKLAGIDGSTSGLSRAHGKKLSASLVEIVPAAFTVNDEGDKVVFASGNLMAKIGSFSSPVASASEWKFGGVGEYVGDGASTGNEYFVHTPGDNCIGKWVDLFVWQGSSATYVKSNGLISLSGADTNYTGNTVNESLYDGCWNGLTIKNGGGYAWRSLSGQEMNYIANTRTGLKIGTTLNARFVRATLAGINGLLLFPDSCSWNTSTMGDAPSNINNTGNLAWPQNERSASQFVNMILEGMVFLPLAGYHTNTTIGNSIGLYWCGTSNVANDAANADRLQFRGGNKKGVVVGGFVRYAAGSVRLVRDL